MNNKYTNDFFREIYNSELDQKHKLDSADSLLVAVLLALSGVGIYYLKALPACGFGFVGCVFLLGSVLFLAAFGFAVGFVIASFWPRDKAYISSPADWETYVKGMEDYYSHFHDEEEAGNRAAHELANLLREQYVKAGEINRTLNIRKMGYQTRARRAIAAAVLLILLNAVPACFVQCAKTEPQTAGSAAAKP